MAEKVVEAVLERYSAWVNMATPWLTDALRFEQLFRGQADKETVTSLGFSDTPSLEFFRVVTSVVSAEDSIMFAEDPWMSMLGKDAGSATDRSARISEQVALQQHRDGKLRVKNQECLTDCAIYGTTFAEAGWRYRTSYRQEDAGVREVVLEDGPVLNPKSIWRLAFDPTAVTSDSWEWVIDEEDMTEWQVRSLIEMAKREAGKGGAAIFKEFDALSVKGDTTPPASQGAVFSQQIRNQQGFATGGGMRPYRVKKYWGLHPTERFSIPAVYLVVVVNDVDWCVQMLNPWPHGNIPYLAAPFIPLKESLYGWGLGHLLEKTQAEIKQRQDYMNDTLTFSLLPVFTQKAGTGGTQLAEKLPLVPGGLLPSQLYGELEAVAPNLGGLSTAFQLNNEKRSEMRVVSGGVDQIQGTTSGDTLGEVRIAVNEASRKIQGQVQLYAARLFRPFIEWSHENSRKMMPPLLVRMGGQAVMATGGDLIPDPTVELRLGLDQDNRNQYQRRLNSALDMFAKVLPLVQMPPLAPSIMELAKYLAPTMRRNLRMLGVPLEGLDEPQEIAAPPGMEEHVAPPLGAPAPSPMAPQPGTA